MKLPNGFGSVYKISTNRRRPWIARKTTGWDITSDEQGQPCEKKQLYYTIGYYKTRQEALESLIEYNKKPIGAKRDILLKDLYDKWSKSRYSKIGAKTKESYVIAWNHLKEIEDMMMSQGLCAAIRALQPHFVSYMFVTHQLLYARISYLLL